MNAKSEHSKDWLLSLTLIIQGAGIHATMVEPISQAVDACDI